MFKTLLLPFFLSFGLFYYVEVTPIESSQLFLTIATFAFAIFMGFFISRQGQRYSSIRDKISGFDGLMSALYRDFGHLGKKAQQDAGKIMKKHYQQIIQSGEWDYHLFRKSSTITDLHTLLDTVVGKKKSLLPVQSSACVRILHNLDLLQGERKGMIALHLERIPAAQWVLLTSLAFIVVMTVFSVPSYGSLLESLLKAVFSVAIIASLVQLVKFDHLRFYSTMMGDRSNKDIVDIIDGKL